MQALRSLLTRHWRGELPLIWALLGPVLGIHLLVRGLFALNVPALAIWPLIIFALVILIWQTIGAHWSTDAYMAQGGQVTLAVLAYGVIGCVVALTGVQIVTIALGPAQPSTELLIPRPPSNVTLEGNVLALNGDVTLQSHTAASAHLRDQPGITTFHLDSPGGAVAAARGLAHLIETYGLNTHVTGTCFSACPLVFMAGTKRTISETGQLGFHSYAIVDENYTNRLQLLDVRAEENRDREFYAARGLTSEFIEQAFQTPHNEIWRPNRATLKAAGALTD